MRYAPLALLRRRLLLPGFVAFQRKGLFTPLALAGLLLFSGLSQGFEIRPPPLPATCKLKIKTHPRIGETVQASFRIIPRKDLKGLYVEVKGNGIEVLGGERTRENGDLSDVWIKVLASCDTLKRGLTRSYPFRIRFSVKRKLPVGITVAVNISEGGVDNFLAGQAWVLLDEHSGELKPCGSGLYEGPNEEKAIQLKEGIWRIQ